MAKLDVPRSPCTSCPYRKDTPPGVWHESEYQKLRGYDTNESLGTFLCHHTTTTKTETVCRGWLTVHRESAAARIATMTGQVTDAERYAEVPEELYESGNEAAEAGLSGVARPGRQARKVIQRLSKGRS